MNETITIDAVELNWWAIVLPIAGYIAAGLPLLWFGMKLAEQRRQKRFIPMILTGVCLLAIGLGLVSTPWQQVRIIVADRQKDALVSQRSFQEVDYNKDGGIFYGKNADGAPFAAKLFEYETDHYAIVYLPAP